MYSYLELENKSFEDFYLKFCGMQECKPNYSYGHVVGNGIPLCSKGFFTGRIH